MKSISRAQFLSADWRGQKPVFTPPWARPEPGFSDSCDGCGKCLSACGQGIIYLSFRRRPALDFTRAGCTFCGDCAHACPTGALQKNPVTGQRPWPLQAGISVTCLAMRGTVCMHCIEACEYDAIIAKPALRGRVAMHVDPQACTGCGVCIGKCPVNAVTLANKA